MTRTKLSEILPAARGWSYACFPTGPILFAPSSLEADRLMDAAALFLAEVASEYSGCVQIVWPGCEHSYRIIPELALAYGSKNQKVIPMIQRLNVTADEWQPLVDKISESEKPRFLVSMDRHCNIIAPNEAGLILLGYRPEQVSLLLEKSLPAYWSSSTPPTKEEIPPPKPLTDLNALLRERSFMVANYQNWRENYNAGTLEWTAWRSEVQYVPLPDGGHGRMMTCLEWEPIALPVPA